MSSAEELTPYQIAILRRHARACGTKGPIDKKIIGKVFTVNDRYVVYDVKEGSVVLQLNS